ncbi:MAG: Nif3-like dinuclear metal center hexameric protein [Candidatus Eremiobacteraeota bacterium]|nr:Nif3-like dinuclear metal center hexameric protein [Candidatus Eremiobacteraeota bacterium]MCW5867789.1 Nif3-like dinuclear metal center hexameric protein [Candidatus Eremiobacteraeota bacterium]
MSKLADIVAYLDRRLDTRNVPEPYGSNGLQVEASQEVTRVGFAVDACLESFEQLKDCQLIVVHHGLFWPKISRVTGVMARSIGQLFGQGTSLYASHLPLDLHPELGNNAQILQQLGLARGELFAPVGYLAEVNLPLGEFHRLVESRIGPARLLDFGPAQVTRVAVSSGQASVGMVDQAVSAGAQVMLTGEAGHPIYHAALQAGLSIMLAGHYQTEIWGVKALMPELEKEFSVQTRFVDIPTGF